MASVVQQLRVLLVGDDSLARGGLRAQLSVEPSLAVVGEASSADASSAAAALGAELLLWDLGAATGRELERLGQSAQRELPVVALAPDEDAAADAWASGAAGVVARDAPARRILTALWAVEAGSRLIDGGLAGALHVTRPPRESDAESLTPRELEVLPLLAQGLSNKEIAQRLGISDHTAKFHVNAILSKLSAQSRTEAVVRAARLGLLVL